MLDGALDTAARQVQWFDEQTTKKTDEVIQAHRTFFDELEHVERIIVLGHSLSLVDYPYFREIVKNNGNKAEWTISWHGSRDLENIKQFVEYMGIKNDQVTIVK